MLFSVFSCTNKSEMWGKSSLYHALFVLTLYCENTALLNLRIGLEKDGDIEEEPSVVQTVVPELNEKDQKNYDIIQKAIEGK